jgi:hypothetical protein
MKIGQHSLEGEIISLKQPFLVVERRMKSDDSCMDVLGVVKKKAIFKTRPKPIT